MLIEAAADALLAPLAKEEALLLAVSGGPDSVALMLLAAAWSLRSHKRLVVATVDHGLRAASHDEALRVGEWARALCFEHRLLVWEGEKPSTRIQERAREARYALLAAAARDIAPRCAIVTAHHADDQAETILFRLTRGSGVAGLAGMAPRSMREGAPLLRPLLGVTKARFEAICAAADHPFLRDPSNADPVFARARLRSLSETLAAQGLSGEALLRLGARAARAEQALAFAAQRLHEEALVTCQGDETIFDARALAGGPRELLLRVIGADIVRRGLASPRLERLERAAAAIAMRLQTRGRGRITLAGLSIRVDESQVTLTPAPPRRNAGDTLAQTTDYNLDQ
jgi:tRNA(Ile)-lysidine synthase